MSSPWRLAPEVSRSRKLGVSFHKSWASQGAAREAELLEEMEPDIRCEVLSRGHRVWQCQGHPEL